MNGHSLPYRLFFESSDDAMFVVPLSADGSPERFCDANVRACQILGCSRERLLTLTPVDLGADYDLMRWHETDEALRHTGEHRFEARFRNRRGEHVHVEVTARLVELEGIPLAVAIVRDISPHARVEEALRESERDLNAMINAHPETVILTGRDSTILRCNRVGAERFGTTAEQLVGQKILDLSPPDIRPNREDILKRVIGAAQVVYFQDSRNGIRFDHTITPIDNGGRVERVAVFSRDITAQFVRNGIESLLATIDRCILNGGNIDGVAALVCEQLAEVFYSPWVCFDVIRGAALSSGTLHGGHHWKLFTRMGGSLDPHLSLLADEQAVRFSPAQALPAPLAGALEAMACIGAAIVPVHFDSAEQALLLIGIQADGIFHGSGPLALLDHVASRLRVAWGMTHEVRELNLLRQALEATQTAVLIVSPVGKIVWCNEALEHSLGAEPGAILGRSGREFTVDNDVSSAASVDAMLTRNGAWSGEREIRRLDGSVFTVLQSIKAVVGERGELEHYIITQEDITARKRDQEHIRYLAEHDPLTGLWNRMALMTTLDACLEDGRRAMAEIALLYLDIDHFKPINDQYGHAIGDQLLVAFSRRIEAAVRHQDRVCRLGGDEFVIVLRQVNTSDAAAQVARHLLGELKAPLVCGDLEFVVSTSIGIAVATPATFSGSDLLGKADAAMYHAKRLGRNRFICHGDLDLTDPL